MNVIVNESNHPQFRACSSDTRKRETELTEGVDGIILLDDQLFGEETEIFDGVDPIFIATDSFVDLILQVAVEDVVVCDAE